MAKRYVSKEVRCPFYRSEDSFRVICEGPCRGVSVHLAFDSPTHRSEYEGRFCKSRFDECIWANALYAGYESEGKSND